MQIAAGRDRGRVRILRVIARLNVGGPAIQAITLTRQLESLGYDTTLVRGVESPDEGNMDYLADELGVRPTLLKSLSRDPRPADARALISLVWRIARDRPQVVHTHAAKAGTLGRVAAWLAPGRRQRVVVHTFHGHSLTGYFTSRRARLFRAVERFLARRADRLIAVSSEVRDELIAMGIAPADRFEVIPLGFDLGRFDLPENARLSARARIRADLSLSESNVVVTLIGRLVPIKRIDRFLRMAAELRELEGVEFLVVGDGELRDELKSSAEALVLGDQLHWLGFRRDIPEILAASDVVVLTSDNEGTPVSLIEAQAAGVPVVATNVGGVSSAVLDGETGRVVSATDEAALASAVRGILETPDRGGGMGASGRRHALRSFTLDRLVNDIDALYRDLLKARGA
jgi:glycosyltransferase involved in cell wall biosynthesis